MTSPNAPTHTHGEFIDFEGERYYAIRHIDRMKTFFISLVSNSDHWLFISTNGGLTAGRVSPKTALFPYITVDKIHDSAPHTGSKTLIRVGVGDSYKLWEPFNREHDGLYDVTRNLYKNTLGNKLCFEEINHSLGLRFRYTWSSSDRYGFVRDCELAALDDGPKSVTFVDGLQNMLPAGTPAFAQTNTSNLVDAYKWTELDDATGLAYLTLYSAITDRAEPSESLKATTVFSLGLTSPTRLVSNRQLADFRAGRALQSENRTRGMRGAYFVSDSAELEAGAARRWRLIADLEKSQSEVAALRQELGNPAAVHQAISDDVAAGSGDLARIMAHCDGFQTAQDERVTVHHYANVLFNVLRGGLFVDQYTVPGDDFVASVKHFNQDAYTKNATLLSELPDTLSIGELVEAIERSGDTQLIRLAYEYLPITFGRRHGDPSRPWNQFTINVKDDHGNGVLSYEGNWRDIFQNWEALLLSFPEFTESVIAKFVNASTVDGYNPYRITKEGIDWEVEEPDDPWSYIGYWGDHQIIYLQKLLELSQSFHPQKLKTLLRKSIFCYANVPYRIASFEQIKADPKNTVAFDEQLAARIDQRVARLGADGKLWLDDQGQVLHVNLMEKLLVPLLSKLGNLVVDGGIWLTTQRPEWNDANNALVGHGLSMVTLYYMRRYLSFMLALLADDEQPFEVSTEVAQWLESTAAALQELRPMLGDTPINNTDRYRSLQQLGEAASHYRSQVYAQETFSGKTTLAPGHIRQMLTDALAAVDHSLRTNRREDGLYHAYNLIGIDQDTVSVDYLYPMLEGQVAALSAGTLPAREVIDVLKALFDSAIYRANQDSFMLYPDRALPGFLEKNTVDEQACQSIDLLATMLERGDKRLVERDVDGTLRFNADFHNAHDLNAMLVDLQTDYGNQVAQSRDAIAQLYEQVFNHKAFTGRSGTMFGFEGLGSIYWHMVSKLLLAVMENFFRAVDAAEDDAVIRELGDFYYRVSKGIGFNKTPTEYGAFPTDPYSHTPENSGARQPGMTGQVKEEVICRFAELGVRVKNGCAHFQPALLRQREFLDRSRTFSYLAVNGQRQTLTVPAQGLAFTWCQLPVVYVLDDSSRPKVTLKRADGTEQTLDTLALDSDDSHQIFARTGSIVSLGVTLNSSQLLDG